MYHGCRTGLGDEKPKPPYKIYAPLQRYQVSLNFSNHMLVVKSLHSEPVDRLWHFGFRKGKEFFSSVIYENFPLSWNLNHEEWRRDWARLLSGCDQPPSVRKTHRHHSAQLQPREPHHDLHHHWPQPPHRHQQPQHGRCPQILIHPDLHLCDWLCCSMSSRDQKLNVRWILQNRNYTSNTLHNFRQPRKPDYLLVWLLLTSLQPLLLLTVLVCEAMMLDITALVFTMASHGLQFILSLYFIHLMIALHRQLSRRLAYDRLETDTGASVKNYLAIWERGEQNVVIRRSIIWEIFWKYIFYFFISTSEIRLQ